MHTNRVIILKSPREIEQLKIANAIAAEVLERLKEGVKPGVATQDLDGIAEETILSKGASPAFKGYRGYPKSICASIHEEIVPGIPGQRKLKEGDIVSLDVGVNYHGYYGDAAISLPVGDVDPAALNLLKIKKKYPEGIIIKSELNGNMNHFQ